MNNNAESNPSYLEHEKSFDPEWNLDEKFPGTEEIIPLEYDDTSTYSNYEQSLHPDWNEDELSPTTEELENQESPFLIWPEHKKVKSTHKNIEKIDPTIASGHEILLKISNLVKEVPRIDCKCISTSVFWGYEQSDGNGLFVNGIDMSLWENGDSSHMFLVGKSEDFLYIGRLSEVSGKYGFLKSEISFKGITDLTFAIPVILYFEGKANTFLKLLKDSSQYKVGSSARYLLLTRYSFAGIKPSSAWREVTEIQNPLLYLITNALLEHNRKSVGRDMDESFRDWIYKNTVIPRS
jgi:hypothetical protein